MPIVRLRHAVAGLALIVLGVQLTAFAPRTRPTTAGACDGVTGSRARVACLAIAFEATLSDSQRTAVRLQLNDSTASRWTNLPCGGLCRNGLQLGTLNSAQASAAEAVARAALSAAGYATLDGIRHADSHLGERRAGYHYEAGIYFIAFLGTPSARDEWILQLGGHHFAINVSYRDGAATSAVTPNFVGLEPQRFELNGTTYAPLDGRRNAIYAMVRSLDARQLERANLAKTFTDVVVGPGKDGQYPESEGLLVSSLDARQRDLVRAAISEWVSIAPDDLAAALRADYESDAALDRTRIAWAMSPTPTLKGSYVRIDGPRVWIELVSNTGAVFKDEIHVHSVWRDKARDYGRKYAAVPARVGSR